MTMTTAACATAVALLAGTACFAVPAAAQGAPVWHHAKTSSAHSRKLFMSAVAEYDAGLRRGRENSTNNAYLRGFRDGTSSEAYSSRAYAVTPYADNPVALVSPYAGQPVAGYSPYGHDAVYAPVTSGYLSYDPRSVSYGDGFTSDQYASGYAPHGLMDVAVAPVITAAPSEAQAAHLSYCAARYRSFDPVSSTFLADDGNRYYCR
jgi:hypothetical protein